MRWLMFFIVVSLLLLSYGCMESVDYSPDSVVGNNTGADAGVDVSEVSNDSSSKNLSLPLNVPEQNQTTPLVNQTLNLTVPAEVNNSEVNNSVKNITYGAAVSKGNSTYMFRMNDQINLSGGLVRVENIWPTSVLIFVKGEREKIYLGEETYRIMGLNITVNEIFYDPFAEGRQAYLRIV